MCKKKPGTSNQRNSKRLCSNKHFGKKQWHFQKQFFLSGTKKNFFLLTLYWKDLQSHINIDEVHDILATLPNLSTSTQPDLRVKILGCISSKVEGCKTKVGYRDFEPSKSNLVNLWKIEKQNNTNSLIKIREGST